MKLFGSHVSASGGIWTAPQNASSINCNGTFSFFLSSPRTWKTKTLSPTDIQKFKTECESARFSPQNLVPHGNYLINLASSDERIYKSSIEKLLSEMAICNQLGIIMYNVHVGSAKDGNRTEALQKVAKSINSAHECIPNVIVLIENMAGQGNVLCKNFDEIAELIKLITQKSRIGVCLDTCHLFAGGIDIKDNYENVLDEFENKIGLKFLKAIHLNDSKDVFASCIDRHEDIGNGHIGEITLKKFFNDKRLQNVYYITETPCAIFTAKQEMKMLSEWSIDNLL